jgi:hypothetical protein
MNENIKELHDHFYNVKMPSWYKLTSYIIRILGFSVFVYCLWWFVNYRDFSIWSVMGFLAGIMFIALPSLPKAYIEQRNIIKGLKDGSFQDYQDKNG